MNPDLVGFLDSYGWLVGLLWLAALVLWRREAPGEIERAAALRDFKAAHLAWWDAAVKLGAILPAASRPEMKHLHRRVNHLIGCLSMLLPPETQEAVRQVKVEAVDDFVEETIADSTVRRDGKKT